MKRLPFLFAGILGVLVILGVACGGAAAPTATKAPPPKATPTPTRPVVAPTVPPTAPGAAPGVALEIASTVDPELKFENPKLTAKAGTVAVLRFKNNSKTVQHNWVLVKGGTKDKDEVANAGATAGPASDWIPRDARILANTKLIDPGKTGEVQFTTPAAGTYQFVCTFPGHNAAGMFGEFTATP